MGSNLKTHPTHILSLHRVHSHHSVPLSSLSSGSSLGSPKRPPSLPREPGLCMGSPPHPVLLKPRGRALRVVRDSGSTLLSVLSASCSSSPAGRSPHLQKRVMALSILYGLVPATTRKCLVRGRCCSCTTRPLPPSAGWKCGAVHAIRCFSKGPCVHRTALLVRWRVSALGSGARPRLPNSSWNRYLCWERGRVAV